jgi:hypothetical protein
MHVQYIKYTPKVQLHTKFMQAQVDYIELCSWVRRIVNSVKCRSPILYPQISLMKSKVFNKTLSLTSQVRTQGLLTIVSCSELGDPLLVAYSFAWNPSTVSVGQSLAYFHS